MSPFSWFTKRANMRSMDMVLPTENTRSGPVKAETIPIDVQQMPASDIPPLRPQDQIVASETEKSPTSSPASTNTERSARRPTLLTFDEIPAWYQESPMITRGYRPVSNSFKACMRSLFYMHNETVNIFSHLIPSVFFLVAECCIYRYFHVKYPDATVLDRLVFALYLLSAMICLAFSAIYHTVLNHSERVYQMSLNFDLVGILVLTFGLFWSGIYVGFYCETTLRWVYWALTLFLCLSAVTVVMQPALQGYQWRTLRICTFVGTGSSGAIPVIHAIAFYGFNASTHYGTAYYIAEGALLALGALFYGSRFPESVKLGRFDIVGASHQIFHVLVVLATVVHLLGITLAYDYIYHERKCRL